MEWTALVSEQGFVGAAVFLLCGVVGWLTKRLLEEVEGRRLDSEKMVERMMASKEKEIATMADMTASIREQTSMIRALTDAFRDSNRGGGRA